MIEIEGKYNKVLIMTDNIEQEALSQIYKLLEQPWTEGSLIRVMADVHAGAGCVVGYTQTLNGTVVPNLVGVK